MYGWQGNKALVGFQMNGKQIKFVLQLPDKNDREFTHTPTRGNRRSQEQQEAAYEQAVRQRWKALALVIKAKLEAVESGITIFEDEFLAHIVLPDGRTAGEYMVPQIEEAYRTRQMPPMLPMLMERTDMCNKCIECGFDHGIIDSNGREYEFCHNCGAVLSHREKKILDESVAYGNDCPGGVCEF